LPQYRRPFVSGPTFSGAPPALDDIALRRHVQQLAGQNKDVDRCPCFLGAGVYDRYVPPVVPMVMGRSEFYTAYTPYQPEVSQGNLQSIYEFQSLVCRLTGMEVANASLYDGATALAEAMLMAREIKKRSGAVLPASVHPAFRATAATYLPASSGGPGGEAITESPYDRTSGLLDLPALDAAITSDTACVVVQQPNFFGGVEDLRAVADMAHAKGALLIVVVEPVSLGLLETPGACGADIVVGEGQSLGLADGIWRPPAWPVRVPQRVRAPHPRPHRGRHRGRRGHARLHDDAAHARTGHPPRPGHLEHLHEPGAVGARRDRVSEPDGQTGPASGRRTEPAKGPLRL
jgi:glycine cleavage system pyridoxal-binding protein P